MVCSTCEGSESNEEQRAINRGDCRVVRRARTYREHVTDEHELRFPTERVLKKSSELGLSERNQNDEAIGDQRSSTRGKKVMGNDAHSEAPPF